MATRRPLTHDPAGTPTTLGVADALSIPKIAGNSPAPTFTVTGITGATIAASAGSNDLAGVLTITLPAVALGATLTITCVSGNPWPVPPVVGFSQYGTALFNLFAVGNPTFSSTTAGWVATITIPILSGGGVMKVGYQVMC